MKYIPHNAACSITWFMYWPSSGKKTILFSFSEYNCPDTGLHGGDASVAN